MSAIGKRGETGALNLEASASGWTIRPRMPDGSRPKIGPREWTQARPEEARAAWLERRDELTAIFMTERVQMKPAAKKPLEATVRTVGDAWTSGELLRTQSKKMLDLYDKGARLLEELRIRPFPALAGVIPELSYGPRMDPSPEKRMAEKQTAPVQGAVITSLLSVDLRGIEPPTSRVRF